MKTEIRRTDDKKVLISVRFHLAMPEGHEPEVEAVFSAHWPEDWESTTTVIGLVLRSVTDVDTRETVTLPGQFFDKVVDAAALKADEYERSLYS